MQSGQMLAHYRVEALIGRGGMGEVWRARDTQLDRDVALKILPPEFAADPERTARFEREAKVLASLNHPNIAAIHGFERTPGCTFLAMELVEGEDLSALMARGPLPVDEAVEIARQIAEGLEAAHERGVTHRDLKPANVKLTGEGRVKILDFGLARAFAEDAAAPSSSLDSPTLTADLTQKGVILGTAAYMSPEQARGKIVDHRTDIWSLGVILHEMLTGRRLFEGETLTDTVAAVLRADIDFGALPPDTPLPVRRLLRRCLERDPRQRLRDAGEARVRLARWQEDPDAALESSLTSMSAIAARRPRAAWAPWAIAAAAVLAAAFFAWRSTRRPETPVRYTDWTIDVPGERDITLSGLDNLLLSPDGEWYGWITVDGIHMRRSGDRKVTVLPESEGTVAACFSPDSRWIAFVTRGALFRIGVSGGAPYRICDDPLTRGVAWVDASTIVLSDGITTGLKKVDLETGALTAVTLPDSSRAERSHRWPSVVPGRRGVLYECQYLGRDYDNSDIRWLDLDSGKSVTVHRGGAMPMASARGLLYFVREHTIYARRLDLGTMQASGLPQAVRENVAATVGNQEDDDGAAQYAIDSRGDLFYLDMRGNGRSRTRLSWLTLADGGLAPFTEYADFRGFMISPDGTKIVAAIEKEGESNLYVLDPTNGNQLLLTGRPSVEYLGAWSPDSREFYWTQASDDGGRFEVWRRPVDCSRPAEYICTPVSSAGSWVTDVSPDGRWLIGMSFIGGDLLDLFTVDLSSSEPQAEKFVGGPAAERDPDFTSDGSYVVYGSGSFMHVQLLIRRFPDTGAVWSLPGTESGWLTFGWVEKAGGVLAVDERGMFLLPVSLTDGGATVGALRLVLDWRTLPQGQRIRNLDFAPDGERAVVEVAEAGADPDATPSLAVVTGWEQGVLRRLEQADD